MDLVIIEAYLDRKLVKTLFMPLVYGKTLVAMIEDISEHFHDLLSKKDIVADLWLESAYLLPVSISLLSWAWAFFA